MIDLMFLATPIILGWCVSIVWEAALGIDADVRWNHLLSGIENPRRFRPPPCEALEALQDFDEWALGLLKASETKEELVCSL